MQPSSGNLKKSPMKCGNALFARRDVPKLEFDHVAVEKAQEVTRGRFRMYLFCFFLCFNNRLDCRASDSKL
jgi:hypothetical protein